MNELIAQITNRIAQVNTYVNGISEADFTQKESPEKWSKKEILGHLADSAQNNIRRMVVGQYQADAHIVYSQNNWVKAADYQHYDTQKLLLFWSLLNEHFCIVLSNLPQENYQTLSNWSQAEPDFQTLEYIAHDYLKHLDHHLTQMSEL
jgi:DinB superfamily